MDKESDINEENEDTNTEKEFSENEERQFNSDRKLNKLMKQINQYTLAMDRIEKIHACPKAPFLRNLEKKLLM